MAEFTKGELKESKDSPGLLQIDEKTLFCVFPIGCNTTEEIIQKRANTLELLYRWKSQPDLYAACKEIDHFFNESVGQVCTEKQAYDAYHNSGTSDRVKATLAKADKLKGDNDA